MSTAIGLSKDRAALLVVDIQERLAAAMPDDMRERVIKNTGILIETAKRLGLPIIVSQQYPKGLGATVPAIEEHLAGAANVHRFDKLEFAVTGTSAFNALIAGGLRRDQWIVTGMEAHVCVYQSARGLAARGYQAHVVADAVCSRTEDNWQIGLGLGERVGGIITSTEVVVFDLLGAAGTDDFKTLSKLIK